MVIGPSLCQAAFLVRNSGSCSLLQLSASPGGQLVDWRPQNRDDDSIGFHEIERSDRLEFSLKLKQMRGMSENVGAPALATLSDHVPCLLCHVLGASGERSNPCKQWVECANSDTGVLV